METKGTGFDQSFKKWYYRYKMKNADMHEKICRLYKPFSTKEALTQLSHPYNTQYNKAMNNSVASFAPKGKTFDKTESLDARVVIVAGIQILGYELFWESIYDEFGLTFDNHLLEFSRIM